MSSRHCHRAHSQDNHVDAAGGIPQAVGRVREHLRAQNALGAIKIEVQRRASLSTTVPDARALMYCDKSRNFRNTTLCEFRIVAFSFCI